MTQLVLIIHDIRSIHNVGSLLRTADCLGVHRVYITGYSPYPIQQRDSRLPHEQKKVMSQLHKTALGTEKNKRISYHHDISLLLEELRIQDFRLVGLEQAKDSIPLAQYQPADKIALLLGREVEGIETDLLTKMDDIVEIPMKGQKESLNVVQAAAIALFVLLS